MSTWVDPALSARYEQGKIIVERESGVELRFPVAANPRLARGTPEQLNTMEVSPYGLHWPELDEDLSFRGLREGDYGPYTGSRTRRGGRRANACR